MASFGLGLDYKYFNQYADGIINMIDTDSMSLSHLSIVGIKNKQEAAQFKDRASGRKIIHHLSNISPCGFSGPDLHRMQLQDDISRELNAVWCGEDIGLWSIGSNSLPYFTPPLFTYEIAEFVARGICSLQEISSIPFLAEVPSVGCVIGDIGLAKFFSLLTEKSECGVVLDLSHVYSYALATGNTWEDVLIGFPLNKVKELHIAGGRVNKTCPSRYIDSHSDVIVQDVFNLLTKIIPLTPTLEAVTYEVGVSLPDNIFLDDCYKIEECLEKVNYIPGIRNCG